MKKIIAIILIATSAAQSPLHALPRLFPPNSMTTVCKKMAPKSAQSEKETLIKKSLNTPISKRAALFCAALLLTGLVWCAFSSSDEKEKDTKKK